MVSTAHVRNLSLDRLRAVHGSIVLRHNLAPLTLCAAPLLKRDAITGRVTVLDNTHQVEILEELHSGTGQRSGRLAYRPFCRFVDI